MLRTVGRVPHTGGKKNPRLLVLAREKDGQRHCRIGTEGVCGKCVLPVGFLSLSSCLRKTLMKKAIRNKNNKKEVCSVVESTNRCLLKPIELPEAFWF